VDWVEVRLTAQALGYEEAAKLHGIKIKTLKERARRHGWILTPAQAQKRLLKKSQPMPKKLGKKVRQSVEEVPRTTSADDLLVEHQATCRTVFRRGFSSALRSAGEEAERMTGEEVLHNSRKLKDLADAAKVILGVGAEGPESGRPLINLNIRLEDLTRINPDSVGVIDI
jgi:hypothetical protein